MVDRQDIDALLISALYGELTPAEEARLQTHLDSHPADRTALADLTFARNAVRDSRILTVQLEPPQAVSAMLLQEAARRAPKPVVVPEKEKEGWFQRFVRSFVAHPAMAAAAMLVVVLGVAGTLYLRSDRSQFAEHTVNVGQPEAAEGAGKDQLVRESQELQAQAGSAYEATLDDKAGDSRAVTAEAKAGKADEKLAAPTAKKPARRPGDTYITVPKTPAQPMDLENESTRLDFSKEKGSVNAKQDAPADRGAGGEASTGRRFGSTAPQAAPKPDPAPATATASPEPTKRNAAPGGTTPPPPSAPVPNTAGADEPKKAEESNKDANGEDVTWAREVHNKVVVAVKANNCREATNLAVALEGRAPGYYQQNVQNDRQLKQCVAYINAEREREAERVQRARAQQRRNADEAPKAAKPTGSSR